MTHAPQFWADNLPLEMRQSFWFWVNEWQVSGETAYHWTLRGDQLVCRA